MIEQCTGCNNWQVNSCIRYAMPERQHSRVGGCPMRTHRKIEEEIEPGFIDPLKASKRKSKGIK